MRIAEFVNGDHVRRTAWRRDRFVVLGPDDEETWSSEADDWEFSCSRTGYGRSTRPEYMTVDERGNAVFR